MFEDHLLRKWPPSGHPGAPFPASSKPEAASSAIALAVSCDTIDMGTLSQLWRLGQVTNEGRMNCHVFSTWFHHRLLIEMASRCFNFHPLQQSKHSWDIHFPMVFLWFSHGFNKAVDGFSTSISSSWMVGKCSSSKLQIGKSSERCTFRFTHEKKMMKGYFLVDHPTWIDSVGEKSPMISGIFVGLIHL